MSLIGDYPLATKYVKFRGKARWFKVYEPEEFRGTTNWKVDLVVDDETLKLYKSHKIAKKVKEHEGETVLSFTRPKFKEIKGVKQVFSPPKIYDKDGNEIVSYTPNAAGNDFDRVGERVLIGNGSDVEITVAVYDWGTAANGGVGQRLESVKIIDLIEYSEGGGGDPQSIALTDEPVSKGAEGIKAPW